MDLFRGIFGLPKYGNPKQDNKNAVVAPTREDYFKPSQEHNNLQFNDSFTFSLFENTTDIHEHIEQQMEHIFQRVFKDFSLFDDNSWPLDIRQPSFNYESDNNYHAEPYLNKDINLDGEVTVKDLSTFFDNSPTKRETPKFVSQSVTIRTVRHPDGTVETTKTTKDHTGREETIITKEEPEMKPTLPLQPFHDENTFPKSPFSDENLFSKYFRF